MDPLGFLFNCPELVSKFIFEKFDLDQLKDDEFANGEKIIILNKVLKFVKTYPQKYHNLQKAVFQKILSLQEANGKVEKQVLLEYLKNPYTIRSKWMKESRIKDLTLARKKIKEESLPDLTFVTKNDHMLINNCLKKLFRTEKSFAEFEELVEPLQLKKLFWTEKLLLGEDCQNSKDLFTENELKSIFNKRELVFVETNIMEYKQNDKVEVRVRIKNVTRLTVRIFEVNTLNFLLENNHQNYQTIDVSGLISSGEYKYQYTHNAIVSHEEVFCFQNIETAERGVFIVDYIGEDIKSRCVLYKGSLNLVYEKKHGRSCLIFDQSGKVCKGKGTGFYIGNTFFEANATSGIIHVPITIGEISKEVVTVHDGFANKCMLNTKDPKPQFSTNLVYNSEGFIAGNKVSFIIEPMLKSYQNPASVTFLSNLNATIVITNIENVQTKTDFKDLKISENKDIVVDLIFPSKVRDIRVNITAELKIKKDPEPVSHSHVIKIDRKLSGDPFNVLFQKNKHDEIKVLVLGKNGEKRKNMCVDLNITLKHKSSDNSFKLITDEDGSCNLGKVENYGLIKGTCDSVIAYLKNDEILQKVYPSTIILKEKEILNLPIYPEHDEVSLFVFHSSGLIKDEVPRTAYSIANKQLHIRGLDKGTYLLSINEKKINIQVIKGEVLYNNEKYLWTTSKIHSLDDKAKVWSQSRRETDEHIEFSVKTMNKNLRARLLTYNFIPEEYHQFKNTTNNSINESQVFLNNEISYERRTKWNNYSHQIKLGDEPVCTYDRWGKKKFMGNTLEKPGVILKRHKVRETTETEQNVMVGDGERCNELEGNKNKKYKELGRKNARMLKACSPRKLVDLTNIPIKMKEFIENPGLLIPDIEVCDGIIKIDKKLVSKYSFSYLHLSDGSFSSILPVWHDQIAATFKDCTLKNSKKDSYIYSYSREVKFVNANSKVTVDNISNTQISLITNLKELFESYQTLVTGGSQLFNEWVFRHSWTNLFPMEKLKKYDKFASHEFNLFLYFKDNDFFAEVVAPFIENKKEKQIMDFFLLGKTEEASQYFDVASIKQFNLLEQIFIDIFADKINPKFSNSILYFLKAQATVNKLSNDVINSKFEALLNANSENKSSEFKPIPFGLIKKMNKSPRRKTNSDGSSEECESLRDKIKKNV